MHIQARDLIDLINRTCDPSERIAIGEDALPITKMKRAEGGRHWYFVIPDSEAKNADILADAKSELRRISSKLDDVQYLIDEAQEVIS